MERPGRGDPAVARALLEQVPRGFGDVLVLSFNDEAACASIARRRATETFRRRGVAAQVSGVGSLFQVHLTAEEIVDYRATLSHDDARMHRLHLALLNPGVLIAPRGMVCLSTPMTDAEIDHFITALDESLLEIAT